MGNAWFPVNGGLFFGDDATARKPNSAAISRIRRISAIPFAAAFATRSRRASGLRFGVQYDTGLPFEFQCPDDETQEQCIAGVVTQYGQGVVSRVNFNRGRIYPSFQVNVSAGATLYKSDRLNMQLQVDGQNLNNVLWVIDFGGLFSGNAIGPPRSYSLRLTTNF